MDKFYMSGPDADMNNNGEENSNAENISEINPNQISESDVNVSLLDTDDENTNTNTNKIIITTDNDFICGDKAKLCSEIMDLIKDDKYNILNIFGDFLYKDKFDINIFETFDINNEKYLIADKYLGSFSIKSNEEVYNILIKSRYSKFDNENVINYIMSQALDIDGKIFEESEIQNSEFSDEEAKDIKDVKLNRVNKSLAIYIYITCLTNAIKKGMFRLYNEKEYNDTKIKGRIDVSRHIVKNQSIQGKVAYTTREYTSENVINKLILKTYVFFERNNNKLVKRIMSNYKDAEKQIVRLKTMFPNIDEFGVSELVSTGNIKIVNPVYKEYEILRKVCIGILKTKGRLIFDENDRRAKGIVMNISNLWELFVYKNVLRGIDEEVREDDEKGNAEIRLMKSKNITKHDFRLKVNDKNIIFDAKYSGIWEESANSDEMEEIKIDKLNKEFSEIINFAVESGVDACGIIFPYAVDGNNLAEEIKKYYDEDNEVFQKVNVENVNIDFYKVPYLIPMGISDYDEFSHVMKKINKKLIKKIQKVLV